MMFKTWRVLLVLALVLSALFSVSGLALAKECVGGVIATGLNGPMGVLVDPDGNIWVTDSGLGGEEAIKAANPETGELVDATLGDSARVVRINAADDSMDEIASLRSYGTPEGSSGGNRLALLDGTLYVSVGDWLSTPDLPAPAGVGTIVSVDTETGETTQVFDGWAFESTENPYGVVLHAHPYGLLAGADGTLWVADAGANAAYSVDPATGEVSMLAVMEPLPGVFPRPDYDNQMLTDPVPTSLAVVDGQLYASLLSGAPFVPGSAKVLAIAEDGTISDYATGLTMLTDMRAGPDGNLYATTFAIFGEQGPGPGTGAVVRIGEGDTSEVVVSGLTFATSLDFDADGNVYVTTNGVGAPGSGTVECYPAVTEAEGTPVADWLATVAAPPAEAAAEAPAEEVAASETMTETVAAPAAGSVDIIETATGAGGFRTLLSALDERGLTDALKAEGPFTVFAPSDTAFGSLPLSDRLKLYREKDALTDALLNHVVEGTIMAADITDGMTATSLQGGTLTFTVDGSVVMVNGVPIGTPDVLASNGVIHILDGVITTGAAEAGAMEEAPAAEATAEPTEEAAEEPAAEATAAPAEEAAAEATAVPAEEAAAEATAVPAEEPAAEATAAPAEEPAAEATAAPAEEAPETLPATGGSSNSIVILIVAVLALAAMTAFTLLRRRTA